MTDSWSEPGDLEDRRLDKALHHAFIREEPATHGSVFDVLGREGEEIPRVLLRDLPAESELHSSSLSGATDVADRLPETYRVAGEIAEGGAGVVLRVRDLVLGRDVAVKLLRSCHRQRPSMVRRFLEEAQIGGQLQHPGIVPVHEIGLTADQRPFFSMKLVQGQTLAELLAASAEAPARECPRPRLVRIFAQICQTMAYAHARGVIHRDLKPANVMVGAYGEVQVMDWGMAKVLDGTALDAAAFDESEVATLRSTDPSTASVTGSVMGTPAYMPPEQARGEIERLDERSDVFSLGAILCEILTGAPPYTAATADELKQAAARGDLTAARQRLQDCGADPELVQLAASCLRHEPDNRPAHAGVLAEVVSSHLTSVEERAREAELEAARAAGEAAQERRSRRLSAALFASILCTATVGGGAWVWWDRTERQRAQSDQRAAQHAVEEVLQLEGEAKAPGPAAVSRWAVALAAAERATTAAAVTDAVEHDLRARVAVVHGRVEASHAAAVVAAAQAAADRRMAERLDEIDMAVTSGWDWSEFDARTTAAFHEYGIDVDALRTEEAVRRVRESSLYGRIVHTLEGWATARSLSRPPDDAAAAQRVRELARHVEPDPWLEQLRRAIYERWDRDRLRALVKAPQALERPLSTVMIADHIGWAGDPALAAELWRRAQLDSPGDFWVNLQLGYWLSQCGPQSCDEALRAFTAALALRPKSAVAHVNVGWLLVSRGDLDRGQAWLEKALELEPGLAPAHVNLGYLHEQRGELDLAIGSYREAIRLDPSLPIPHHNLGAVLRRRGALDDAIAEFRAALALEPTRLATRRLLAHTLQRTGQLEEAIAVWRTACDLAPNDATSRLGLGRALQEVGRLEEALTALRHGHELGSQDPGWTRPSARWVAECEQLWEAQQRLAPLLEGGKPPADAAAAVALAELCRSRGELVAAAGFRKQAFGLDPELASDLPGGHLFAAARDAVAASAQEDAEAWRREALAWLQSALGMWRDQAAGGGLGRAKARRRLQQWQQESTLARVRDPDALTRLPADEQKQWRALWDEVARLCAR